MDKYRSKNHSKFKILYHIIFVCKYRKRLLIQTGERIKQYMILISNGYNFEIIEIDKDHIHIMIESEPKISPLSIVRVLKQQSTKMVWNDFSGYLSKHFWKEKTFWTDDYFVSSIGEVSSKTLKEYILNQG